jgi:hypothetical protein
VIEIKQIEKDLIIIGKKIADGPAKNIQEVVCIVCAYVRIKRMIICQSYLPTQLRPPWCLLSQQQQQTLFCNWSRYYASSGYLIWIVERRPTMTLTITKTFQSNGTH